MSDHDTEPERSVDLEYRPSEIEELLTKSGGTGLWQWLLASFLSLSTTSYTVSNYVILFFFPPALRYWCRPPDDLPNDIFPRWLAVTHPYAWYTGDDVPEERCVYYDVSYAELLSGNVSRTPSDLKTCEDFVFSKAVFGSTLYDHFDIACQEEYYRRIIHIVYTIGLLIGSILFGWLSDMFGRKPALFISLGLQPIAGLCVAFSTAYPLFVTLRFVYAIVVGGGIVVAHVLLLETAGNKKRSFAAGLFTLSATIGFVLVPIMNELVFDWQKLQVILSCPTIVFLIFVSFIPESPLWLLMRQQTAKTADIVQQAARINRKRLPSSFEIRPMPVMAGATPDVMPVITLPNTDALYSVFSHLNVLKAAVALGLLFFGLGFASRVVIFLLVMLIVDVMYQAFFLAGAMAFLSICLGIGAVQRFRHHKSVSFTIIMFAVTLATAQFFPLVSYTALDQPRVILLALAQLFSIMAFCILYNYGARAYPTVLRGTLFGCTVACGILGGFCAPPWVQDIDSEPVMRVLVVCAAMPVLCLLVFWLPTVHGRELPDTMADAHNFSHRTKPQRWTTARPKSTTYEEVEIQAFNMDIGEQPEGLDFSLNRVIVPTLAPANTRSRMPSIGVNR